MRNSKDSLLAATIGLAAGVFFILILAAAVSLDKTPMRFGHADRPTEEDRAVLVRLLEKADEQESIQLLRAKYPPVDSGIYQYGGSENEWEAIFVYGGGPKVRLDCRGIPVTSAFGCVPVSLISYHSPTIWTSFDKDGNMKWIELRCSVAYVDSPKRFQGILSNNAINIIEILGSEGC